MRRNTNSLFAGITLVLTIAAGPAALMMTGGPAMARDGNGGGGGSGGSEGRGEGGANPALSFLLSQRGAQRYRGPQDDHDPTGCYARLPTRLQCRYR